MSPAVRDATVPPEARGVARDEVRLAVVGRTSTVHTTAAHLPDHLSPGDLLVVNTSATLPSALDLDGLCLHVSTALDDGSWVVEVRQPDNSGPAVPTPGEELRLPGGVRLRIDAPHPAGQVRLWRARPASAQGGAVERTAYLRRWGRPIRYRYVRGSWPLEALQNVYASQPGSAEMPSAGRPLTARLLVRLMAAGVVVAPVVLHTGVASQEKHEPPQPEEFAVPAATARLVASTRAAGRRVVAVRTTVVRALESAATVDGRVVPTAGWTSLVLDPTRPARVVDGLLTGLHEPQASHLKLLAAVAGRDLVDRGYAELDGPGAPAYLWHEFGDSMLLLP